MYSTASGLSKAGVGHGRYGTVRGPLEEANGEREDESQSERASERASQPARGRKERGTDGHGAREKRASAREKPRSSQVRIGLRIFDRIPDFPFYERLLRHDLGLRICFCFCSPRTPRLGKNEPPRPRPGRRRAHSSPQRWTEERDATMDLNMVPSLLFFEPAPCLTTPGTVISDDRPSDVPSAVASCWMLTLAASHRITLFWRDGRFGSESYKEVPCAPTPDGDDRESSLSMARTADDTLIVSFEETRPQLSESVHAPPRTWLPSDLDAGRPADVRPAPRPTVDILERARRPA